MGLDLGLGTANTRSREDLTFFKRTSTMSEKESKLLKYTKRASVSLGFFTIVLALIITVWILPSLHDFHLTEPEQDLGGFHSPVLAFQFAKTFYDLKPFSNNPNILEKMDNAHSSWDMIFPFVYNGFIFTNSITYLLQKGRGNSPHLQLLKNGTKNILILLLITTLCITTISFDILENLTLLELSKLMKNNRDEEVLDANLMELRYRTWMKWLSLGCSFFVTMQLEHYQSQKKQSKPKKSTITEQLSMITCLLILVAFLVSENSWGSRLISEENAAKILETMFFFVASTLFFYFVRASKNIHTFSNALNNNNCEEQRTTKKI